MQEDETGSNNGIRVSGKSDGVAWMETEVERRREKL